MPGMCANVARGWMLERLEQHMGEPDKRTSFQTALQTTDGLVEILESEGLLDRSNATDRLMARHIREDWLDENGGFWPMCKGKEPIIRSGFLQAIERSDESGSQIAMRWICMGDQFDGEQRRFECAVTEIESTNTTLLIFLTPSVGYGQPQGDGRVPDQDEPVWIVCDEEAKKRIVRDAATTGTGARPTDADCKALPNGLWEVPMFT